jgi:hypothetical protein
MENFDQIKPRIIEALNSKARNLKCAACYNNEMILIDGFFNRSVQKEINSGLIVGGPVMPTIGLVCKKCGHIMEFSLGALGLLSDEPNQLKKDE